MHLRLHMEGIFHVLCLWLTVTAHALTNHCKNHTFSRVTNSELLHFSKENSDKEFGIYDKFKCLHCCCRGYKSIEWFKDGLPYPWPTNVSTLIIRPESGNQTICSHQSTIVDSGRYWCLVRNDTHFLKHEVVLQISGPSISMGWPKTTYRPRDQEADHGESARFFCEAFVGTVDLPDFQSEITWERNGRNQSFFNGDRVLQEPVYREEKRLLGSYLYFKQVTPQDYGEYTCKVKNLGDQVLELSAWLKKRKAVTEDLTGGGGEFWMSFCALGLLILTAFILTFCLYRFASFRLLRNRLAQSSRFVGDANKDVLVIYHENNENEALKTVSALRSRHLCSYSVLPLQLKSQLVDEDLKAKANSYKAVLALLSPSLMDGCWSCENIHQFIQGLLKIHFTVACIFLEALPVPKSESREWLLLKDSLSKIQYTVGINGNENWKFWDLGKPKCSFQRKGSELKGSSQPLI